MFNLVGFKDQFDYLIQHYLNRNLHSSIIFHGPKGIGKKTFINKFVSEILSIDYKNESYLHHINLYKNNSHPNIKILERLTDQKSKKIKNNITIEQIRSINKFIKESPSINNLPKIIIIDSADDLNTNSANSFLKNLEEPSNNTFIFLISNHLSSLLPTIRSRCLKLKFSNHNYEDYKKIINEQIEFISEDETNFLFDLTYGSPGISISLYEENILEIFEQTLNSLSVGYIDENCIELAEFTSKFDNDKFKSYLLLLKSILVIIKKIKNDNNVINSLISDRLKKLVNLSSILTTKNIIDRFDFLSNNENDIFTYNLDKKLFMLKFLVS